MLVKDGREIFTEGHDLRFDAEAVPFADTSLDLILCIFGLESVNDLPGSLIQFRRALRPDGLFLGLHVCWRYAA